MLADRMRMAAGGGKKPPDEFTKILLHMNGSDGSTTFIDEIFDEINTWNSYNLAQLDTAEYKFGGASAYFNGANYISKWDGSKFALSSDDFTIDFWLKFSTLTDAEGFIFGKCDPDDFLATVLISAYITDAGELIVYLGKPTGGYFSPGTYLANMSAQVWHHCAIIRNAGYIKIYIDGVQKGSTVIDFSIRNSPEYFYIGSGGSSTDKRFKGWVEEFRYSVGIARWIADFTPPAREY